MKKEFEAIVVGGGPGGSACSIYLARKGIKVLLLEKDFFPRDKVCGDAISGKSISIIKDLGLKSKIEQKPHSKIDGVTLSSPNGSKVKIPVPLKNGKKAVGYCVRRKVFDSIIFETAVKEKKVAAIQNFHVTDLIFENDFVVGVKGINLKTKKQNEFRSNIVVGADGAHSIVAAKLGANEVNNNHYCTAIRAYYKGVKGLDNTIEIHFVDELIPGYLWIFPLDNGLANVGAGIVLSEMQKRHVKLTDSMFKAIKENKLFKDRFGSAKIIGPVRGWTLPLGSKHRKIAFNGAVLLGDAASLIDPFTGEGIGNALYSARIASKTISSAVKENNFSEKFLAQYENDLRQELDAEFATSYKMQLLGRHKFLLNHIISKAAKKPKLLKALGYTLVQDKPFQKLVSPWKFLKMFFL